MLFPNYAQVSVAGSRSNNEDSVYSGRNGLIVIDGATGLDSVHIMQDYPNDVVWFSHNLTIILSQYLDSELEIEEIFSIATRQLRKEFYAELEKTQFSNSKIILNKLQLPTAAVAIVRLHKPTSKLEVVTLADTTVLVTKQNLKVEKILDLTVPRMDDVVIKELQKLAESDGITLFEARKKYSELLRINRRKANEPDGYWVASLHDDFIPHLSKKYYSLTSIKEVIAMSDGYWAGQTVLANQPMKIDEFAEYAGQNLTRIPRLIRDRYDQDEKGIIFPRTKHCDDMSAVYGNFIVTTR